MTSLWCNGAVTTGKKKFTIINIGLQYETLKQQKSKALI